MNEVESIAESEQFNADLVRSRLVEMGELGTGEELTVRLLAGGRSNLTFELASKSRRWILRRPPIGHRLETAHDMGREVTVQRALAESAVPVPRIVFSEEFDATSGGSFYVMDKIEGQVLRRPAAQHA